MEAAARQFLLDLLHTPSPSGFEQAIQKVVRQYLTPLADEVLSDLHGNLIGVKNAAAPFRVLLDGHCDQIGLLVSHIDAEGYLYAQPIGGWDPQQLIGQRMTVWGRSGPVPAVIARKPIHLLTDDERKKVVDLKELWLDIGAKDKEDARQVVSVGDAVTLQLGFQELRNGLANAPGMDDRVGVWVVVEAFRRAAAGDLRCALYVVSAVQEEIGLRGAKTAAFGIDPQVGIAVDVTHATDCPTIDKRQNGDIALGKGPVVYRGPNINPHVADRLLAAADRRGLPHQVAAVARACPNDANVIQLSRAGVAAGLVSIPNRYMHSAVEVVSLDDLDRSADLLAGFVLELTGSEDFRP